MGKIVAIGGGFDGSDADFLVRHIISISGKEHPNYLLIPTTCFDICGREYLSKFFNWGCGVDTLYLTHAYMTEEIIAQKIRSADVIHVPGGNLGYVAHIWKKTGADKYLKEAYEQGKVLFGASSGAMCWFREGYDDCGPENEFVVVEALGLLPYCNCPHYEGRSWQTFNNVIKTRKISGIACENEAAICFVDDKRYILHSPGFPEARCWFFDAEDGFRRYDLDQHPEILKRL